MRIWSPGVAPVVQGNRKGKNIECNEDILLVPGGGEIYSIILSAFTELGRDRTVEHFVKYFIKINNGDDDDGDMTQSDRNDDLLSKIDLTVDGLKLKRTQQIILHTSTSARDFDDRFYTKAILLDCINNMCISEKSKGENKQVNIDKPAPKIKDNKATIIKFLIKWRKLLFKKNPLMKEELVEGIMADFDTKSRSTVESQSELLKDSVFQLSELVHQNERYTAFIKTD